MMLAKEMGARGLLAKSDSLLVTGQVTGEYQAKDPQMAAYLDPHMTCLQNSPVRARGQAEDSDSGNSEDTSNNHGQNGRNPAR